MKQKITEKIAIPEGIVCEVAGRNIECKKDGAKLSRKIGNPEINAEVKGNELILSCEKGNKNHFKFVRSLSAHLHNMFHGLQNKFIYQLEACNVHFPMTIKADGEKFVINNFLGEKTPRVAHIIPGTNVEVKGTKITVSSPDRELAGQTAANIEKATKIRNRDRRVFQDGIYIVSKPAREIA